jgi:hypothetical protein
LGLESENEVNERLGLPKTSVAAVAVVLSFGSTASLYFSRQRFTRIEDFPSRYTRETVEIFAGKRPKYPQGNGRDIRREATEISGGKQPRTTRQAMRVITA